MSTEAKPEGAQRTESHIPYCPCGEQLELRAQGGQCLGVFPHYEYQLGLWFQADRHLSAVCVFSNQLFPNIPSLLIVFRGWGGCNFLPFSSSAALFSIVPPSIPFRPLCITGRSVKAKINDKSIALVSGVDMLATARRPCFVCTLLCYGNLMVRATENDDDKFLNECVLGFGREA